MCFYSSGKKRKEKKGLFFFLKATISWLLENRLETYKREENGCDGFRQINVSKSPIGEKMTVRTVTNHTASTVLLPIGPYVK